VTPIETPSATTSTNSAFFVQDYFRLAGHSSADQWVGIPYGGVPFYLMDEEFGWSLFAQTCLASPAYGPLRICKEG
jgi:hypothetical protein